MSDIRSLLWNIPVNYTYEDFVREIRRHVARRVMSRSAGSDGQPAGDPGCQETTPGGPGYSKAQPGTTGSASIIGISPFTCFTFALPIGHDCGTHF